MKQIIRLTEGDLHRIIENCVRKALNEDWTKTYDKWADTIWTDPEEGDRLNKKWSQELKDEYGDKRGEALNAHCEKRDAERAKRLAAARKRAEQYNKTHPKKKK